ncbi:MAG: hypothetical protein CFE46_11040 [Burkholderiales bacterium PBB6]|nr:MAG: hypothetical protein CFE46_11040 [Burkholderiales bacterium PBB6]
MRTLEFIAADVDVHREPLVELNVAYLTWVFEELAALLGVSVHTLIGQSVEAHVRAGIDELCGCKPPAGRFYLLRVRGASAGASDDSPDWQWAGMGGLRDLGKLSQGVAEIKRVYIRPAFRGQALASQLMQRLLADASMLGYQRVCLDSAQFMQGAHRLYERHGFVDAAAYPGTEVPAELHPHWRFMARSLGAGAPSLDPAASA